MNRHRRQQLARIAWYKRLAALKEDYQDTGCRAWIAKINHCWKWSSPGNQQLPNPFRN